MGAVDSLYNQAVKDTALLTGTNEFEVTHGLRNILLDNIRGRVKKDANLALAAAFIDPALAKEYGFNPERANWLNKDTLYDPMLAEITNSKTKKVNEAATGIDTSIPAESTPQAMQNTQIAREGMTEAFNRKNKGRKGTILTSALGLTDPATVAKKSLLGQ